MNVTSVNALSATPTASAYAAARAGVHSLTETAAVEYAGAGIRVNALAPGAVRTPMLEGVWERLTPHDPREAEGAYRAAIPAGRIAGAEEAGEAVAWLCSDAAGYVTGASLVMDGGLSLAGRRR